MTTVTKTTTKGQITLPSSWRKRFKTNQFLLREHDDTLIVTPVDVEELDGGVWETVFDATKHNKGKGVPIDAFIRALKKTL